MASRHRLAIIYIQKRPVSFSIYSSKNQLYLLTDKDKTDTDISIVRPAYTMVSEFPPCTFRIFSDKSELIGILS